MRGPRWCGLVLVGILAAPAFCRADASATTANASVPRAIIEKLGRGLGNTASGWLELPLTIKESYRRKDPATSFCTGTLIGVFKAVQRTAVGVYETVTFLFPIPENYAPILPPLEYALID